MSNDLMSEMVCSADGSMPEVPIFYTVLQTKKQLIHALAEEHLNLVRFDAQGLPKLSYYSALKAFLEQTMADVVIDRTEDDFSRFATAQVWFWWSVNEITADGKGVHLREGVRLHATGQLSERVALALDHYWEAQKRYAESCRAQTPDHPRPLRIRAFNNETFAPYGSSLSLEDQLVFKEIVAKERYYTGGQVTIGDGETWELGRLVADTRSGGVFYAQQCDSHKRTDEVLVPDRTCVLTVSAYRTPQRDAQQGLSLPYFDGDVFIVREGQPVVIHKGIMHTAPTRLGYSGTLTTPVLFRKDTTVGAPHERDIEFVRFQKKRLLIMV